MVVDFDDFHETNHRLDLLHELKRINPKFRCTLFAIPGLGSSKFWRLVPDWCELAVHGWRHPDPYECSGWSYVRAVAALTSAPVGFVKGFKAPGWQISDAVYLALDHCGYWVADQHLEDGRRAANAPLLPVYFYEDSDDRWHGHVQNVEGNGLEERWRELVERVASAESFQFCSEAVSQRPNPEHS